LERRDVEDAMLIYASTTEMRAASERANQPAALDKHPAVPPSPPRRRNPLRFFVFIYIERRRVHTLPGAARDITCSAYGVTSLARSIRDNLAAY